MKLNLSFKRVLALLCISSITLISYAQKTPNQLQQTKQKVLADPKAASVEIDDIRQTPSLITLKKEGTGYSKAQAKGALDMYLSTRAGIDNLVADKETKLLNGIEIVEYQQYYRGVKVDRSKFKVFVKEGRVEFFNGSWYDVPVSLLITPRLEKSAALNKAKGSVNARKYAWEQVQDMMAKTTNIATKAALQKELDEYLPEGELVVIKDFTKEGVAQMRLAYKFNIYALEPVSRAWVYIDAEDGRVLLRDEIIKHANNNENPASTSVATTVQTRYAGQRVIKTKQISGTDPNTGLLLLSSNPLEVYVPGTATYGLIDDSRGGGIETYDLNGVGGLPISLAPAYSQGKSFTDVNNNWTLAEHKRGGAVETENDDIAWDAHWGASVVYDYWKEKQNRLSFDGQDGKIKSFIHSGAGYDNAFWNGSVMTYGDGSYPAPGGFRPLTSLDVCGHEIGHGVCSFTSDLVYAKESGAMNEGLSDVWAACVEYFAIKKVDPSLANVYKPFYIGEQISADPNSPLRRMDNPQAAGDPDTYGGTNWENPDCSPSLANDQCGVHTNSGVLNKWFYLMTVGSGAGSGPDAIFAGEDDGMNDLGKEYNVTGLGFDVSEKITYLTEIMLTSTATFAEARSVSVQVAAALSGNPCSNMVKSVTDAWYAVGVGAAFVQPCTVTYGFTYQPGAFVSEAQSGAGCNATYTVTVPVILPPNSTAAVTVAGTATTTTDYTISGTSLANTGTQPKKDSVVVYVKNDAVIEGDETVILNLSVSNAGTNPVNSKYTLHIVEDDVVPVIGAGLQTLLSETFTRGDGFADPMGWTEILEIPEDPNGTQAAQGKNQWGIFGNKLTITGREELTGTQLLPGTYNTNSTSSTIIKSPLIDARGLNTLQISFDYEVQGEVDPSSIQPDTWPALDYMAIVYSFDGVAWYELAQPPFTRFASAIPTNGAFSGVLPSFLNNKQFYIGFRWNNDPLIGGPVSVSVDNLELQGATRNIENDVAHNSRENVEAGQDVYFYSVQDGEILARAKNTSSRNFGCTHVFVEKGGNGTFNLYQGTDGLHKVSDKIIRIEAAAIYKATSTVTLYYTEAQLLALEQATGKARTALTLYQVDAPAYAGAKTQSTKKYTPVYTAIPGAGGSFTISFNEKINGSYALGTAVSTKGLLSTSAAAAGMETINVAWTFGNIYPNPGTGLSTVMVKAPQKQKVRVEVVNVSGQVVMTQIQDIAAGVTNVSLKLHGIKPGSYKICIRDEKDQVINTQNFIKR